MFSSPKDIDRLRAFCEAYFDVQAGPKYAHIAFSLGSREAVDALTERLRQDGYPCLDGPRITGDGYDESVLLDPDGNRIEITA